VINLDVVTRYNGVVTYATIGYHFILHYIFVIWVQGSTQMYLHCRLNIAHCYGLRTWIFCRTPWTDTDETFTICTPLLTHSIRAWQRGCGAGHPEAINPPLPSSSAWTGKMLSGQSTDQTMRGCDTELKLPCCNVYCICWTARRRLFDVQFIAACNYGTIGPTRILT